MNKTDKIIHDAYLNLSLQLPLSDVAKIHNCSKAYVSQVCKGYGLKIDKKHGVISAPIAVIQKIFWPRPKEEHNGNSV